mgnify:FL=1
MDLDLPSKVDPGPSIRLVTLIDRPGPFERDLVYLILYSSFEMDLDLPSKVDPGPSIR